MKGRRPASSAGITSIRVAAVHAAKNRRSCVTLKIELERRGYGRQQSETKWRNSGHRGNLEHK